MNKIRLLDGREIAVIFAGKGDGVLSFQTFEKMTVRQAVDLFDDANVTRAIAYYIGDTQIETYNGYTALIGVLRDRDDGNVLIQLTKEV